MYVIDNEGAKIMKKEYDVKKLKVKRRGVLPGLKAQSADSEKIKITTSLDKSDPGFIKQVTKRLK